MYYTPLRIGGISSRDFRYKVCDVHFLEFHLVITYGAHEISNPEDSRRNKSVES